MTTKPMIQIGGIAQGSLSDAAEAVIAVATCSPIPEVATAALETLRRLGETSGVTVTNCTFTTAEPDAQAIAVRGSDYEPEWSA